MIQRIKECRLCRSEKLESCFSLGEHYINDFPTSPTFDGLKVPIELVKCSACSMLQAGYTAPSQLLYTRKYWFKSGTNLVIVKNLKEIAEIGVKEANLKEGDTVLSIGENDGTFLSFIPNVYKRVGVEPALNLTESLKSNCDECIVDFWHGYKPKAKFIFAGGMFYDLENPIEFVTDIKNSLEKDGIFITELMTAVTMQESNDIGTLTHEHLMHYTWPTFKKLFGDCGLEIFKVERNPLTEDGNGYRIFARHWHNGHVEFDEKSLDIETFVKNVEKNRDETVKFIRAVKMGGEKVYIYGASTKGNLLVQYFGLGPDLIEGAIDKDPEKIGRFMLTGIPIVDESHVQKADYLFCIPYPFLQEFIKREKKYLGQWIVSMPNFKVYP